ncbi:MAG: hypothetical protein MJZ76_11405, partial [Bacteroidales bacterium]|nr:hypothetical protein [Bacteroidales bacterium]
PGLVPTGFHFRRIITCFHKIPSAQKCVSKLPRFIRLDYFSMIIEFPLMLPNLVKGERRDNALAQIGMAEPR